MKILSRSIRKQKEIKAIQVEKEEVKLTLFVNDKYIERILRN